MSTIFRAFVLAAPFCSAIASMNAHELYENVVPADTADCLKKVVALPLATYEVKHDSVKGRRHLGPVGPDLEKAIPESVDVHGRSTLPSPNKGQPPIILERQAVIDKTVIFMNNVAAVQELVQRNDAMWAQASEGCAPKWLEDQLAFDSRMHLAVDEMEAKLAEEADAQLMERRRIVEAEATEARLTAELELVKAEEAHKTLELESQQQQEALEQQLDIARRKLAVESQSKRAETERALRIQEESTRRREELRLQTETQLRRRKMELEQEMDAQKLQMDKERVQAEVKAKVAADQQNEDVMLRKIRAQGNEDRKRTQEAINTVLAHVSSGAVGLMSDPRRAVMLTTWILGLLAGYLVLRETTLLVRQLVETYLGKPGLVRETSRVGTIRSTMHRLRLLAKRVAGVLGGKASEACSAKECWSGGYGLSGRAEAVRTFQDVVLTPDLKEQVLSLAVATKNSKRNSAPYRHLLLYGPPGTGKTMVAKRLAACSGMDCAVMSGGDVGPLGKDAVTELHGLFRWAAKSPRGLLLFIDEAEAFLGKRSSPGMSEDTRNALNALLYNTGSASRRLMMVLATNRAEDLDEAVLDRMDDSLLFPIPDTRSCGQLLVQYFNKYCATRKTSTSTSTRWGLINNLWRWWRAGSFEGLAIGAGVNEFLIKGLAEEIQGFSGREVEKLMLGVQSCAYGSEDGVLTADMLKRVVTQKAREHSAKVKMRATGHV
ncbi:unnamed protein product [Hapterophycus canaliculatus]